MMGPRSVHRPLRLPRIIRRFSFMPLSSMREELLFGISAIRADAIIKAVSVRAMLSRMRATRWRSCCCIMSGATISRTVWVYGATAYVCSCPCHSNTPVPMTGAHGPVLGDFSK